MAIEIDKNLWTFILVIVGSILAVGSAFIQYKDKKEAERESVIARKEAKQASEELKVKTDELLEANRKINKLTNETLKVALGSGYLEIKLNKVNSNDYQFVIVNNSNYPIYDASLDLIDFDKAINCPQKRLEGMISISEKCLDKASIKGATTNVVPNTDKTFGKLIQFSTGKRNYLFKVHSRNSSTIRLCVFERQKNGSIKMSYRFYLYKDPELELIEEKDDIGLNDNYWDTHFFKGINFKVTSD